MVEELLGAIQILYTVSTIFSKKMKEVVEIFSELFRASGVQITCKAAKNGASP